MIFFPLFYRKVWIRLGFIYIPVVIFSSLTIEVLHFLGKLIRGSLVFFNLFKPTLNKVL